MAKLLRIALLSLGLSLSACAGTPEEAAESDLTFASTDWQSDREIDINVSGVDGWGQGVNNDATGIDNLSTLVRKVKAVAGSKKIRRLQLTAHGGPGRFYLDGKEYHNGSNFSELAKLAPLFAKGGRLNLISCSAGFGRFGHWLGSVLSYNLPGVEINLGLAMQFQLRTGPVGEHDWDGGYRTFVAPSRDRILVDKLQVVDHWRGTWSARWWTEQSSSFYRSQDDASILTTMFSEVETTADIDPTAVFAKKYAPRVVEIFDDLVDDMAFNLAVAAADVFVTRDLQSIADALETGSGYSGRYALALRLLRAQMTSEQRARLAKNLRKGDEQFRARVILR